MDPSSSISQSLHLQCPLGIADDLDDAIHDSSIDEQVRPQLCALAVSCRLLRLSIETQFAAACLLLRYTCRRRHHAVSRQKKSSRHTNILSENNRRTLEDIVDDESWIVGACVFLGSKVSEEPRRLRDVINCMHMLHQDTKTAQTQRSPSTSNIGTGVDDRKSAQQQSAIEGSRIDKVHLTWKSQPPLLDDEYWHSKEKLVEYEQIVLRWIGFDTLVSSPHRAIVLVVDRLVVTVTSDSDAADCKQRIVRLAWKLINNAIFSIACLRHQVMPLAVAAVDLATEKLHVEYDVSLDELFDVFNEQRAAVKRDLDAIAQRLLESR